MEKHTLYLLDSSTFLNFMRLRQLSILIDLKKRVNFSEYVYRIELNANKHPNTHQTAQRLIDDGKVGISNLTLEDLDRVASLNKPRRIGFGEITCAIIAERENGWVLCDDFKAKKWIMQRIDHLKWESIEDVLVQAAFAHLISEYDLDEYQQKLEENRYQCRVDLRYTYLMQLANVK